MPDVNPTSGRCSDFGYAHQTVQNTYVAPTDGIDSMVFNIMDNPNIVVYETLNGLLDAENQTRQGPHEVTATGSLPLFGVMGVGLYKGSIGNDTLSGASPVSLGTVATTAIVVGATSFTLSAPLPAAPSGVSDWIGCWATIGTGAGAEDVPICYGSTGSTVQTWPMKLPHAIGATVTISAGEHIFQPNVTPATRGLLDFYSLVGQWGGMFERQCMDNWVHDFNIKGDDQKLTADLAFCSQSLVQAETTTLSTIPRSAAEATDAPFVQQDGGLMTFMQASDTTLTLHNRLKSLDYKLSYAVNKDKVGGQQQSTLLNSLGKRTQTLTWKDLAGQGGALSHIHSDFVGPTSEPIDVPAMLVYRNRKTGAAFSAYFPRGNFIKYDPAGPDDKPVSWDGEYRPLIDRVNTGIAVRFVWKNAVVTSY